GHLAVSVQEMQDRGMTEYRWRNASFVMNWPVPSFAEGLFLLSRQWLKDLDQVLAIANRDFVLFNQERSVAPLAEPRHRVLLYTGKPVGHRLARPPTGPMNVEVDSFRAQVPVDEDFRPRLGQEWILDQNLKMNQVSVGMQVPLNHNRELKRLLGSILELE